jgi:hypothetical protein
MLLLLLSTASVCFSATKSSVLLHPHLNIGWVSLKQGFVGCVRRRLLPLYQSKATGQAPEGHLIVQQLLPETPDGIESIAVLAQHVPRQQQVHDRVIG